MGSKLSSSTGAHLPLMPAKSRVFSELLEEDGTSNFLHQRDPGLKRRKISGLNSRFDRMVEAMNVTHRAPKNTSHHRTRSAGSSSVSSYGVPQTPMDAYVGLRTPGSLGRDFSVIKMRNGYNSDHDLEIEDEDTSQISENTRCSAPLPAWLSETFSTLTKKHPLRLLLPNSLRNENPENSIPPRDDMNDVFCFRSPPLFQAESHVLRSPVAFHAHHSHTQLSLPTPPTSLAFSTPGPASSICQPSPPRSYVPILSPAHSQPCEMTNYAVSAPDMPLLASKRSYLAPAPVLMSSSSLRSTITSSPKGYADNDSHMRGVSSASLAGFKPPVCLPSHHSPDYDHDGNPSIPETPSTFLPRYMLDCSGGDLETADDLKTSHEIKNVFSTPGPAYVSSRPVSFDTPADDLLSDQSDPAYELDYTKLDFQWKPFKRNTSHLPESKILIRPKHAAYESCASAGEDLDSLPPSSDQFSGDDSNYSYTPSYTSKSGSLPLATSSDAAPEQEDNLDTKQTWDLLVEEAADSVQKLPSPGPFQFNPPSCSPSLTHTIVPTDGSSQHRQVPSFTLQKDARSVNPRSLRDALFESPPKSGSAEVPDLDVLKNDLLDTLDKIAPDPPKRSEKSSVNVHKADVFPLSSQDSIESWTEEQQGAFTTRSLTHQKTN